MLTFILCADKLSLMQEYDFRKIEKKWQDRWEREEPFKAEDFSKKKKYFVLTEFFGPSGSGIHLGHIKAYTPTEVIARYMRLKGYNVLYPAGWDAFGLPAENFALKIGKSPEEAVKQSIVIFKNQLKRMGFSFDYSREINTTDSDYYKWTQWIFLQLYKKKMAYKAIGEVNFCPKCKTVLSNEDSQGGICDRCKAEVEKKKQSVWFLKMQSYSEKMLAGIAEIDMKSSLKDAQRNWIGKSEGAEIIFSVTNNEKLKVFTTRPDTLFGVSFMAVSVDNPIIKRQKGSISNYEEIKSYVKLAKVKAASGNPFDKEKTGVKIEGLMAQHPITKTEIPIFVADYVSSDYGTGAVMAVPAHDERDFEFAKKYNLPIVKVINEENILIQSGEFNGLNNEAAKEKIVEKLQEKKLACKKTNYKMQDWPFNRQRYWGEPFPIVFCERCGTVPLLEKELPLVLPKTKDYAPTENGEGPLAKIEKWVSVSCPKCEGKAKRETDTMPNWAGSSWYWLRFLDPHNKKAFADKKKLEYWGAVDLYTGGTEHVTRHMLYASFWHNFLFDIKKVPHRLPFTRRMCNGLILDEKGKKMGKTSGNAVDPIKIIDKYGADAFRLHMLFMGDYEQNTIWTLDGIAGATNFLKRLYNLTAITKNENTASKENARSLNLLLKKIETELVSEFKFNTIIASAMEFMNTVKKSGFITKEELRIYLIALNPFIPHITSELFEKVFNADITKQSFPEVDQQALIDKELEIPVQLLGKLKGTILIKKDESEECVSKKALGLLGLQVAKKIIYIKEKIINIIN